MHRAGDVVAIERFALNVCIYVYIYVYMCIYMYIEIHICMLMYVSIGAGIGRT